MLVATREVMAQKVFYATHVSKFLNIEYFTVYGNIFWGFQVRVSYIIEQICSAESKNIKVSRKMVTRAVPHREFHKVFGSFPSSCSYHFLHTVHSEMGKTPIFSFVLLQGFVSLFSVEGGVLKEIEKDGTVFVIGHR